jgi:hypothetical protein
VGRWVSVPIAVLAVCSGLLLGSAGGRHPQPGAAAVAPSARLVSTFLVYPPGRAHPEGPDADDPPTRPRPIYSQSAGLLWTGGGRHPVWRGCQHVYDPKLGRFIFAAAP